MKKIVLGNSSRHFQSALRQRHARKNLLKHFEVKRPSTIERFAPFITKHMELTAGLRMAAFLMILLLLLPVLIGFHLVLCLLLIMKENSFKFLAKVGELLRRGMVVYWILRRRLSRRLRRRPRGQLPLP